MRVRVLMGKPIHDWSEIGEGCLGTVVSGDDEEIVRVRLDKPFHELAEWDNELVYCAEDVECSSLGTFDIKVCEGEGCDYTPDTDAFPGHLCEICVSRQIEEERDRRDRLAAEEEDAGRARDEDRRMGDC